MKKQTQELWVKAQLEGHGRISRNQALRRYISRLGAIVFRLRQKGMKIDGHYQKTKSGQDYVYEII